MRPTPRPAFAAELDELAAKGFRSESRPESSRLATLAEWLHGLTPRRLTLASGGAAVVAIAIATALVATNEPAPETIALERGGRQRSAPIIEFSQRVPKATLRAGAPSASGAQADSAAQSTERLSGSAGAGFNAAGRAQRQIERSAEITLLAEPGDVGADSAEVFDAVHDVDGIVLRSTTTAGADAGAHFELLIPTPKLGDALAAFSAIDEVRSRHEATSDITAPTVALGERLQDSRAKIDGLLAQLAAAETQSEGEAIEIALRDERLHAAALRARLDKLRQRADLSRVSLSIETGASTSDTSDGTWGIGDALDDAGHILGIAAGVTVVTLAVIAPLALILLLAWLIRRAWLRRARTRALA
jgi:hypothetical protein